MVGDAGDRSSDRPFDIEEVERDEADFALYEATDRFYKAHRLCALQPSEYGIDATRFALLDYTAQYARAAKATIQLARTIKDVQGFVTEQRQLRHNALTQALRERTPNPLLPSDRRCRPAKRRLAALAKKSDAELHERYVETDIAEEDWKAYSLPTWQRGWLATQVIEQQHIDGDRERGRYLRAILPYTGVLSVRNYVLETGARQ